MPRRLALCAIVTILGVGCEAAPATRDADRRDGGRDRDATRPDAAPTFRDTGIASRDGGMDAGHDAASTCIATCTSDSLCAATCGPMAGRIACCDAATARCYFAFSGVCPTPSVDAGRDSARMRPDTDVDADVDAACPPSGTLGQTEIAVSVPAMPGARVRVQSWNGASTWVTLDAAGRATFAATALTIGTYSGSLALLDPLGFPASLRIESGTASAEIFPACIPPEPGALTPLDRVDLVVQRDVATGLCAGSVLSVVTECETLTGDYDASLFDDQPCGPFP